MFNSSPLCCSWHFSPFAVFQTTIISFFAHLPLHLPLCVYHRIFFCAFAIISAMRIITIVILQTTFGQSSLHNWLLIIWRTIFGQSSSHNLLSANPQSIPAVWVLSIYAEHLLCAQASSDWWLADLPQSAPFYNFNCSKPNESVNPFREAQLDNTKLRSAAMVPGFRSCRNTLPYSCLGKAIQMFLWTSLNKGPHTKQCIRSSPHHQFPSSTSRNTFRRWQNYVWIHSSKLKPVTPNLQATKKVLKKCGDHFNTYRQCQRL